MDHTQVNVILNSKIVLANQILEDHVLVFTDKIEKILTRKSWETEKANKEYSNVKLIDFNGYVSPGFIDIHIHGAKGSDTMDATFESLKAISETLIQSGTTGYLATTMTMDQDSIEKALANIRSYMNIQKAKGSLGSQVLGVHLEGPFISPDYKGAQNAAFIQKPSTKWIKDYFDIIKVITLAPEMDESFKFIHEMRKNDESANIVLSMGHTGCSFETACEAYDAGVEHVTHCFNAMTGLHHRNPGAVGATLAKPFTAELITDGVHVHPGFIGTFMDMKSTEKIILVTDAMRASFLEEGHYDLGGQEVVVKDRAPRLTDGTIAGSVHQMDIALKNVVEYTGKPLYEIIKMMSLNPAKRIGLDKVMGSIKEGKEANLVFVKNSLDIQSVYIKGKEKYREA